MALQILSLRVGGLAPLGDGTTLSGIAKEPVRGPVALGPLGLAGDRHGDPRHHGGLDKAVHHYALDHYAAWRAELPGTAARLEEPGAFGENIASIGLTEDGVCLGDRWRLGSALVEVSQARQPCWKLNRRFGVKDMALRVQQSGRTGWYYRVIVPGRVAPDDVLDLVERPHPEWPLSRVLELFYHRRLDLASLRELDRVEQLAASWRRLVRRRIERLEVEDWTRRLEGAPAQPAAG